jgi:enterochelin esterase-like enzyme
MSSGYFTAENLAEAEALLATDAAIWKKVLRYFYFAEGSKYDITYDIGMQTLALFREYGITVHYWEYSGWHQWSVWEQDF